MGFFGRIANIFRRDAGSSAAATSTEATTPRESGIDWRDLIPTTGPLNVATAYRCINILSDSVACLPLQYKRQKGDIYVEDTASRLHYLLTVQPDAYISAFDFWKYIVQCLLIKGNAYIVPVYNPATLELERLAVADPDTVTHYTLTDTYYISDANAGIFGTFEEAEIIHVKNFTLDGKKGISTLMHARLALDISLTGDRETLDRFKNGGNVRGIVSNDTSVRGFGEYQDNELQKTAADIDGRFRAGARIVGMPGQVQYVPLSLSSTDMQFLETRKFSVRDVCRFFGVHPSYVFDDTSNNYKSAENANGAFLVNTLNPLLRKIENELHRKLVAPSLCCKRRFEFDRKGLFACDLESRIDYQTKTIAAGIYTVNEWRREENKPAVEGGDTVMVSANLRALTEATAPTAPAPEPEPTKEPEEDEE